MDTTPEEIKYDLKENEQISVMTINEKKINAQLAPSFKKEFVLMSSKGINQLVIDMSRVDFIDSSGLGALLFGKRQFEANSGTLKLSGIHGSVLTLMQIAKLDRVFEMFSDDLEAIESFNN